MVPYPSVVFQSVDVYFSQEAATQELLLEADLPLASPLLGDLRAIDRPSEFPRFPVPQALVCNFNYI